MGATACVGPGRSPGPGGLPPGLVPADLWHFTPYGAIPDRGTLIYSRHPLTKVEFTGMFSAATRGQVTLADIAIGDETMLFASVHAIADPVNDDVVEGIDASGVSSWGGTRLRPLDLILSDLSPMTRDRRFVIGGDFNASIRFDDYYRMGSRDPPSPNGF